VKLVEVPRKKDFSLDLEAIKRTVNENTKAILINSPNNPTGHVISHEELYKLVTIVKSNDLYLISDEVYENYIYDGLEQVSPASLEAMFNRTITLNAMSKLFSATGFRLGYVIAKRQIIDLMENYHQYTAAGTNHPAQYGFLEALKMDKSFFMDILKSFDKRRLFVFKRLTEIGFETVKPKGAFYIMPSVKNFKLNGDEFSKRLMKNYGVAVVPGKTFGSYSDSMIRISYATQYRKLEEAMNRIEKFVSHL
jgi:aminotransferase